VESNISNIAITECPRDAMQGMPVWIPTEQKIKYLNSLLNCGFDVLDFGSFVSPKAIPQMKDSALVLEGLQESSTQLLAIIANGRGALEASKYERITFLGYPYSVSETFQLRNTGANFEQTWIELDQITQTAQQHNKKLRIYLSMGFGNPYQDQWSEEGVCDAVEKLSSRFDIAQFALSDTIGCATPEITRNLFSLLVNNFTQHHFAAHLHVVRGKENALIAAAIEGGCRHFDTAIGGFGGCPMAKDELTGNLATEALLDYLNQHQIENKLNRDEFDTARQISTTIF